MKKITYLSDILLELPTDCIFNKVVPGIGGTYMALTCDKPYIILEPSLQTVLCKEAQHKDTICAVHEGVTVEQIAEYHKTHYCGKIISTYDGLVKIVKALGDDAKQYNLLIDELQKLIDLYLLKRDVIDYVLKHFRDFKTFCFMSATPDRPCYQPKEFDGIRYVDLKGRVQAETVTIQPICTKNTMLPIHNLIKRFMKGDYGTAHIFCNSATLIAKIIKRTQLMEEDFRIVCGAKAKATLARMGYDASDINSPIKRINFYTSTAYEGCDIYSEDGKTIVISDTNYEHTLTTASVDIPQIVGRCRNSKYANEVLHIFNENRYDVATMEEYQQMRLEDIESTRKTLSKLNAEDCKKFKGTVCVYFEPDETGMLVYNDNLYRIDMRNYEKAVTFAKKLTALSSYDANELKHQNVSAFSGINFFQSRQCDVSFKTVLQQLEDAPVADMKQIVTDYAAYYPCLEDIFNCSVKYDDFWQKVHTAGYVKSAVESILMEYTDTSLENRIRHSFKFHKGEKLSRKDVKDKLQKAYDQCGLKKHAKASDIEKFYYVKAANWRTEDGTQVNGYICLS